MNKWRFYPTLLDGFTAYLDAEQTWERLYGESEEPSLALGDFVERQRRELLDKINRVPFDSEAADRGSCFNEVVDCILLGEKSTRQDIEIASHNTLVLPDGSEQPLPHIEARMNGRTFRFDVAFCREAARYFEGSLPQLYVEASLPTRYGDVLLYGYADYVRGAEVMDAKTTSRYEFGKYRRYWQRHVYPWALTRSGRCKDIRSFEFTVFPLRGGTSRQPLITGSMQREQYDFDYDRSEEALRCVSEHFAEFLLQNEAEITNRRIFGE